MYGIEFFCGAKYGGWRMGNLRLASQEAADRRALADYRSELARDLNPIPRRVRAA